MATSKCMPCAFCMEVYWSYNTVCIILIIMETFGELGFSEKWPLFLRGCFVHKTVIWDLWLDRS